MPPVTASLRLRRRRFFLQSWRDVVLRGLLTVLLLTLTLGLAAETWFDPTPPFALQLEELRPLYFPFAWADTDGDGRRDLVTAAPDGPEGAALVLLPQAGPGRLAERRLALPGRRLVGQLNLLEGPGDTLWWTVAVQDLRSTRLLLGCQARGDGEPRWSELLAMPPGSPDRPGQARLLPDSSGLLLPLVGSGDGELLRLDFAGRRVTRRRPQPHGLGAVGPWMDGGARGRLALLGPLAPMGGTMDLGAGTVLLAVDESGETWARLELPGMREVSVASLPGDGRALVVARYRRPRPGGSARALVWDPGRDSLLWSAEIRADEPLALASGGSLVYSDGKGELRRISGSGADESCGELRNLEMRDLVAAGPFWLHSALDGELDLLSPEGRVLAGGAAGGRARAVAFGEGSALADGGVLLAAMQGDGAQGLLHGRMRIRVQPLLRRVLANPWTSLGGVAGGLVFLVLLALRLALQETLLRRVIHPGALSVGIFDERGRLVYENPAFAADILHPALQGPLLAMAAGGGDEFRSIDDGARRIAWRSRGLPVRSGRWTVLEGSDVTHERESEEQRLFLEKLAVMAHDLKSPLTPIRLQAGLLGGCLPALEGDSRRRAARALEEIDRQVDRSLQLITRFMGMARTEFQLAPVSLPDVARAALAELSEHAWPALEAGLDHDPRTSYVARAEGEVLQLALFELLQNAAQSMDGRGRLTVRLERAQPGGCSILVEDEGPGVPPAHLERVFEPGFTTRQRGTGFGLYFVRRVLRRMGLDLVLENLQPRGLRARIDLPAS